jgi:hypothetical protein
MRVREQLTERVVAIRAAWGQTPPGAAARVEEITLECRPGVLPALARNALGRVNAGFVGLANAGHLLVKGCKTERVITDGEATFRNIVRMAYRERPWAENVPLGFLTADLDALLDALEAGADAGPGRAETWRDRPPLL